MHVMIFEPRYKGHHLSYVQLMLAPLLELGCKVTIAGGPEVFASKEYQSRFHGMERSFSAFSHGEIAEGRPNPFATISDCFRAAVQNARPDHVFIPTADGIVQNFGADRLMGKMRYLHGLPIDANLLRCRFSMPRLPFKERAKLWGVRRLIEAAPISRLFTIDALAIERLKTSGARLGSRMQLMPDPLDPIPTPSQEDARRMLGLSEGARYIGIVGVLDGRKGAIQLLNAYSRANLRPEHKVLLAGRQEREVETLIRQKFQHLVDGGRLVIINKLLTDNELSAAVAATDVICTPYIGHVGPSAMVVRAIVLRKPVLASNYGWIGEIVSRLGAGLTCDVQNEDAFARAVETAFAMDQTAVDADLAARMEKYSTPANFINVWLKPIRQRLGLAPMEIIDWKSISNEQTD